MQNETPLLEATTRQHIGSRYARRFRRAGKLPAVVYGHGKEPVHIVMDAEETIRHVKKGEKVFALNIDGQSSADAALLKEIQFDYLGTNIVHCDFAWVSMSERVETSVHLELVGEAVGLRTAGTLLMRPTTEIEIECRVADIPDHIEVDISGVAVGESFTAGEIKLPTPDMKLLTDASAVVAQIVHGHEAAAQETTEVSAEGAEPEVISEKKKDAESEG